MNLETEIQIELLEQEKARTALLRSEERSMVMDKQHVRDLETDGQTARIRARRLWGEFVRSALSTLCFVGIVGGAFYYSDLQPDKPDPCLSYVEYDRKPKDKSRKWAYECSHSDHVMAVEKEDWKDDDGDVMRTVTVQCRCALPNPVETEKAPQ